MTTGKGKIIGSFEPLEGDDLIRANELKRREGRHSIQEAILRLQAETGKNFALDKAVFAGTIKSYAQGDDKDPIVCEPHQRDMREEIYWDDVIKWIAIEFPRFKYPVILIPTAPVVAVVAATLTPIKSVANDDWVLKAQARAIEIIKRQKLKDLYPSQVNISDEIAKEFRADGIVGSDGKPLRGGTIKRHALKGISSAQNKQLSTQTGGGKRGK